MKPGDAVSFDSCADKRIPAQIFGFAAHARLAVNAGGVQAGVLYRSSDKGK